MKTKFVIILLISALLSVHNLQAKSKVLLRLNLNKGTTYQMTMLTDNQVDQEMMGQKLKIFQKMNLVFEYQVLELLPNKNFLIEYSMTEVKMDMDVNGQIINLDSENPDAGNDMNMAIKKMKDLKLKFEISPEGKVGKIEGIEEFVQKVADSPILKQTMYMFMDNDNFTSHVQQTFNYFPDHEVGKGDTWLSAYKLPGLMNMETNLNFEVAELQKDQLLLNVTSDVNMDSPIERGGVTLEMKMKGTQKGTMQVNPKDGWLTGSDLTQNFDVDMKMKNPQNGEDMEIPMKMNTKIHISVVRK